MAYFHTTSHGSPHFDWLTPQVHSGPEHYLPLEGEQAQGLDLDGGLGAQVTGQGARQVLQLCNAVADASLQPGTPVHCSQHTVRSDLPP